MNADHYRGQPCKKYLNGTFYVDVAYTDYAIDDWQNRKFEKKSFPELWE